MAAQTEADARRLADLGAATPAITGNIKFDMAPPAAQMEQGRALRALFGTRPILLAASTREGEEALLLEALMAPDRALPADLLLVLVPRHPQRFDEVARELGRHGLPYVRRSAAAPVPAEVRVVLGDSMGELFAYYAACDAAFIGGSLLPLGGQNLIEACAVGTPVLVGPHTFNFAEAAREAVECGAARRVEDARALLDQAVPLLADPAARHAMGEAGRAFAARHRGATEKTVEWVEARLGTKAV